MKWLTLTVAAWMSFVSVAAASLAPPRKSAFSGKETARALSARVSAPLVKMVSQPEVEPEFAMTPETEVLLDGKRCAYEDVPADASIMKMEVGVDRKTVLKIHFRGRK